MAQISMVPKKRGPGRPFVKGQSGNPGGRPKEHGEFREAARALSDEALALIASVLRGEVHGHDIGARVRAAKEILDRAWGVPKPEETEHPHASIITGDVIIIDAKDGTDAAALAAELTEEAPIAEPAHSVGEPQPGTEDIPPKL